jgi:8-oxo-dGTP pyrophosphatase MutT (NUDIX family)
VAHRDTSFTEPGHRRIGGLWLVLNDENRALVVHPAHKPGKNYQLVGGGARPKEAPHLAAIREGWEAISIRMVPDTLLLVDYVSANEETGSVEGLNFVYLHRLEPGDTVSLNADAPKGEEPELSDFQWLTAEELEDYCEPYQVRRIRAAMEAASDPSKRGYRFEGREIALPAA